MTDCNLALWPKIDLFSLELLSVFYDSERNKARALLHGQRAPGPGDGCVRGYTKKLLSGGQRLHSFKVKEQ